jgi:hypothetical protein
MTTLFDPAAHEPRTDVVWDAQRARAAIQAIVIETERAFDPDELWAPHPLDQEDDSPLHGRRRCTSARRASSGRSTRSTVAAAPTSGATGATSR